jgi:magnesium-transporting ATPase (P-type)
MENPQTKTKEEILKTLTTSEKGLTSKQAEKKLREIGPNEITKEKKKSQILIFLKQFNSPLIYILINYKK